jgi:hypothetical protein
VSWSEIAAVAGIIAAVVGVIAVVVTIYYGEVERRLARRQLVLAEEQAKQRPSLEVTLPAGQLHYQQPIPIPHGHVRDAHLLFELKNVGQAAAHHVECRFEFDSEHLDLMSIASFGFTRVPSLLPHTMQVNVRPRTHGLSRASYSCTYDEGEPVTGTIEFEIPNPQGEESRRPL